MNGRGCRPLLLVAPVIVVGCGGLTTPSATPQGLATTRPAPTATTAAPSRPPTASEAPVVLPTRAPTQELVEFLLAQVEADPLDGAAQRDLGLALLQRLRETGDPSLFAPAEAAFRAALPLLPDDPTVLPGLAAVQLGRHEFAAALDTGRAATAAFPDDPAAHGVVLDALVELGRYDEAEAVADTLATLDPGLPGLARRSYLRELRGDLPGALALMETAAASPGPAPENTAFALAHVGQLRRLAGDPVGARAAYESALELVPGHTPSLLGLGRLAVGAGDPAAARDTFAEAAAILPLPEATVALGETLEALGDPAGARRQYDLATVYLQLFQASGGIADVDLALFEADHGDAARALTLAEAGYAATPTLKAADALAWALHRLGRDADAAEHVREALRLGSMDPVLRFHAGAIAAARGDTATARRELELALALDPGFSATGAAEARAILAGLPD